MSIIVPDEAIKLIEKVYDDLLSPSAKEVGAILKEIFKSLHLLSLPFKALGFINTKFEKFIEKSIEKTEEKNRILPPGMVILKFYQELLVQNINSEEFELLSNLFSKYIDKTQLNYAHPAFLVIIPQLSSDEIKILNVLKNQPYKSVMYHPFVDKKLTIPYIESNEFPISSLQYPDNFFMYIDHLYSLNLSICRQHGKQISDYDKNVLKGIRVSRILYLTNFGVFFEKACLK